MVRNRAFAIALGALLMLNLDLTFENGTCEPSLKRGKFRLQTCAFDIVATEKRTVGSRLSVPNIAFAPWKEPDLAS